MIEIHAYHGWGFNGNFWDNLKAKFPKTILFKAANRGYFDQQFEPIFSSESLIKIIFTHSYGLHWCSQEKIRECDFLVIFNGFNDFLSTDCFERKKDLKVLNRMHARFQKNPYAVLNEFYKHCFFPHFSTITCPNNLDKELLENDLLELRKTKFIYPKESNIKIIVVSGLEDQIIAMQKTIGLIEHLGVTESMVYQGYGHAIPFTNSLNCWSYLSMVLPNLDKYAKH